MKYSKVVVNQIIKDAIDKRLLKESRKSQGQHKKVYIKTMVNKKNSSNRHVKMFNTYRWIVNYCQRCWWVEWWLQIHHINKKHYDNHPLNLIKLCLVCHTKAHKWDNIYKLMNARLSFLLWW